MINLLSMLFLSLLLQICLVLCKLIYNPHLRCTAAYMDFHNPSTATGGPHTSAARQLPAPYTGIFTTLPPLTWSPSPYTGEALVCATEFGLCGLR